MNKIKFTSGTMYQITPEYYDLKLYNNGVKVYAVTLSAIDAAGVLNKHINITLI